MGNAANWLKAPSKPRTVLGVFLYNIDVMSTLAPKSEVSTTFAEQGYYVARGVFSPAEVAELEGDFDRIIDQLVDSGENLNARWGGPEIDRISPKNTVVLHTHNVQHYSAVWMRALLHPGFLHYATAILGDDVMLHHTKLFQKPGENGAAFPMHQDWEYFPTELDTMMAGIIHVSHSTDEMGCFRVYPGTHKLGKVIGTFGQNDSEILEKYPLENSTPLEAEPGDVVFFHYCLIHGSKVNTSNSIRKTVLAQLLSGQDQVVAGNGHPNEHIVLSGWNYRMTRSLANDKH